jgi:hypothetical protein
MPGATPGIPGCFAGPVRNGPVPPRFAAPNSYFIWELFKVSGGVIRHIEAIMAMFPYGLRPGW